MLYKDLIQYDLSESLVQLINASDTKENEIAEAIARIYKVEMQTELCANTMPLL